MVNRVPSHLGAWQSTAEVNHRRICGQLPARQHHNNVQITPWHKTAVLWRTSQRTNQSGSGLREIRSHKLSLQIVFHDGYMWCRWVRWYHRDVGSPPGDVLSGHNSRFPAKPRGIHPMLLQCWTNVVYAGLGIYPAKTIHWDDVSLMLGGVNCGHNFHLKVNKNVQLYILNNSV